ncbi:hypothetical protein GCM10020331_044320 [Ectobacillus funiculus]
MKKSRAIHTARLPAMSNYQRIFFKHYEISYVEYNIKQDGAARKRLLHDYNSYSTPTVVVDGEAVTGFNIERLQKSS